MARGTDEVLISSCALIDLCISTSADLRFTSVKDFAVAGGYDDGVSGGINRTTIGSGARVFPGIDGCTLVGGNYRHSRPRRATSYVKVARIGTNKIWSLDAVAMPG